MKKMIKIYKEGEAMYRGYIQESIEVGKRVILYAEETNNWLLKTTTVTSINRLSTGLYKIKTESGSVYYVVSE